LSTNSVGSDGANSARLITNGTRAHLFTDLFNIDNTKSFVWSQYLKINSLTGEFGFYIDEYNSNNDWISGQWKGMIAPTFVGTHSINYTPTSASVQKIRLQYYVTLGSVADIILDAVSLIAN